MKVALVTGANGGIGSAVAEKFAENGYFTVGTYNRRDGNIRALTEKFKDRFFGVQADLSEEKDIEKLYSFVKSNFGHTDVLIGCAGMDLYKTLTDTSLKEWEKIFSVNVTANFLLAKLCLPEMIRRKSGRIIFISSVWGNVGASMETAYSSSKFALNGLTKSLAKEVAPSGITVNAVAPGVIDTAMNDRFSAEEKAELIDRTPLSRFGSAREIAEICWFLSGTGGDFVTGQVWTADGGFTL